MNKSQIYQQISELQRQLDNLKKEIQDMPNYGDCAIKRGTWVRDKGRRACFKLGRMEKDGRIYDIAGVLRPVTLGGLDIMSYKQIEEYLIEGARLRGLVGWSKFKWPGENKISVINAGWGYDYRPSTDSLVVDVGETFKRAIYDNGEWAQCVIKEDKPMPKDADELLDLFKEFVVDMNGKPHIADAYMFLSKKGYLV